MKTEWTLKYLRGLGVRTLGEHDDWRHEKAQDLERRTGVPWSSHSDHLRVYFLPTITDVEARYDPILQGVVMRGLARLEAHPANRKTLLDLADATGMDLAELVPIVAGLAKYAEIGSEISRLGDGKTVWFHLRREDWELWKRYNPKEE